MSPGTIGGVGAKGHVDRTVRPARATDATAIGAAQAAAWREAYADVLPVDALAELTAAALAIRWRDAVVSPPSRRHRVLVACSATDVVGFVAFGPSEDADLDATIDAEVHALVLAPDARGQGHGSRLLQAGAEVLHSDGFRHAHAWLATTDDSLRDFLVGAGWAADGATRTLDLRGDGEILVQQVRLHTALEGEAA